MISLAKCLASLIVIWEPIFLQIYTGSLEFSFKLIFFFRKSMQILFTDKALSTITCIRRMDKIVGKVSLSPYNPKIMVAYGVTRLLRCPDSTLH